MTRAPMCHVRECDVMTVTDAESWDAAMAASYGDARERPAYFADLRNGGLMEPPDLDVWGFVVGLSAVVLVGWLALALAFTECAGC